MHRSPTGSHWTSLEQTHFDTLDLNSDGKISYEEFEQAASTASMASSSNTGLQDAEEAAGSILAHFDQDHDGQLNLDELAGLAASHGLTAEMLDVDGTDSSRKTSDLCHA